MSNPLEKWNCLLGAETRPMTDEESRVFIQLNMMPKEAIAGMFDDLRARDPITIILADRLEQTGWLPFIAPEVIAFCGLLCHGLPGSAVLWAFTLARMAERKAPVTFGVDSWTDWEAFGKGVPTEEAIAAAWDFQKAFKHAMPDVRGGNLLDLAMSWPKPAASTPT